MWRNGFLKITTCALVVIGLFMLCGYRSWFPDFYHPLYFGTLALFSPLLIYLPPLFLKGETAHRKNAIRNIQVIIAFSLLTNLAGQLGLYQLYKFGFEYDKLAHFVVCMLFACILVVVLTEWTNLPLGKVILLTLVIIFCSGVIWEIIEASADFLFGTQEWGVYGEYVVSDTSRDTLFNMLGALSGVLLSFLSQKSHS